MNSLNLTDRFGAVCTPMVHIYITRRTRSHTQPRNNVCIVYTVYASNKRIYEYTAVENRYDILTSSYMKLTRV